MSRFGFRHTFVKLVNYIYIRFSEKEATKILSSSDKKKTGTAKLEIFLLFELIRSQKNG